MYVFAYLFHYKAYASWGDFRVNRQIETLAFIEVECSLAGETDIKQLII